MFDKKSGSDRATESPPHRDAGSSRVEPTPTPRRSEAHREAAVIGPSIHIDGDLRGEEDLLIEGEVNGTVQLKNNSLTIGPNGKIRADVYAHSIFVDGSMEGDLYGSDRVHVRKTAEVRGNITSPRVTLEDGARFKGSIEMDPQAVQNALGTNRGPAKPQAQPASAPRQAAGKPSESSKPEPMAAGASAAKSG
jgi:cytoskeletal protein CcmA (bactofilin family)